MKYPVQSDAFRLGRLLPPEGRVRMVLDTDTYNEIDDQFAVVYSLLSPEKLDVQAIYAAPFSNKRASGPAEGMEKSYSEILRLLERLDVSPEGFAFRGSEEYLSNCAAPPESDAVSDLIDKAMAKSGEPLYVVAIGAITNVASALLLEPEIAGRIVVVWLGGHALHWPHTREFNLHQDLKASRTVFDCGVPLVHIPCMGVTSHLHTTAPEMEEYVRGRGPIGDYLYEIFREFYSDHYARSKVLWDLAAVAYLVNPSWTPAELVHSPIITSEFTWGIDRSRHLIRSASMVDRDRIFGDLFGKLERSQC